MGNLIAVGDIFIFGQDPEQLENAAVTRNANAIYRILLEETGDNTAMYTGSIEYTCNIQRTYLRWYLVPTDNLTEGCC